MSTHEQVLYTLVNQLCSPCEVRGTPTSPSITHTPGSFWWSFFPSPPTTTKLPSVRMSWCFPAYKPRMSPGQRMLHQVAYGVNFNKVGARLLLLVRFVLDDAPTDDRKSKHAQGEQEVAEMGTERERMVTVNGPREKRGAN